MTKRIRNAVAAGLNAIRGPVGEQLLMLAGLRGGRDITRGDVDGMNLQPEDKVLTLQGMGNYEIYERLLTDDRVHATLEQRRAAVVSCPWEVVPGGPRQQDRIAADFVKEQLTRLPWDEITDKMLFAKFYGFSVAEIMWGQDGSQIIPTDILVRNRRRFVFEAGDAHPDYKSQKGFIPKLLTNENPEGEVLPREKFWIFNTGADHDDDPYGKGLAHQLYWPVWFKKNHHRFWLTYSENFAAPTPVGKYAKHVTEADKQRLLEAVKAVHSDTALVIPEDMQIELIEASRSGTPDYKSFCDQMNNAITMIVLSETMTMEQGSSYAQANVHFDMLRKIVAADASMVNNSFNQQVILWLMGWNYPNAAAPKVIRIMDDSARLKLLAERDEIISRMGYLPKREYLEKTYDIELADSAREPPPDDPRPPATRPPTLDFTEGDAAPLEALEEVMDSIDENEWKHLAAPLILPILNRAQLDPDSIRNDLASLYPEMDTTEMENKLARLLFIAGLWGRLSEKKKIDDALTPPPAPGRAPDGRDPAPAPGGRDPIPAPGGRDPAPDAPPPGRQPGAVPPGREPVPPGSGGVRPPGPLNIGYAVRLPPSRAIDYFRQKGFAITFNWWEMWEEAHSKAFTVAKATRLDILETIRKALDKALAEGQTEAQFIKELQPLLEKAGWWGKQTVVSPDGIEQIVQLGSPRRLQTIFRVNMSTAYNAARYRQQMENVDSRPYWKYVAVMDERTRHSHAALNNKVFRYNDPIWDTLYPPNGWNCRCVVVALSATDLKEQKLQVSDSADGLREISQEVGVDKTTGEVIHRPGTRYDFIDDAGNPQSMTPDPGWSYNPGK